MSSTYDSCSVNLIIGGILRFVNPRNWNEVILDLDNGGLGEDQEYWKMQGTSFPLPPPEQNFGESDLTDGDELISTRKPNREITLILLLTGTSKKELDSAFRALFQQIDKVENYLEYRPEGSLKSLWYKTYQYIDIDLGDYELHKDRSNKEFYAYNVTITLPCYSYAEGDWREPEFVKSLGPNDGFEEDVDGVFKNWTVTGNVTVDPTNFRTGTQACSMDSTGGDCTIIDDAQQEINEAEHYNFQLFGKELSGTSNLSAYLLCYSDPATYLGTLIFFEDVNMGATWLDRNIDNNPVIYPSGSGKDFEWPAGTKLIERAIYEDGNGISIVDSMVWVNSELISSHQLDASFGLNIPPGRIVGDVPALMDIYLNDSRQIGNWVRQYSDTENDLYALDALTEDFIIAVGYNGAIVKYEDGYWSNVGNTVLKALYDISILDTTHMWAIGANGTILFSNDGFTWTKWNFPAFTQNWLADGGMESWYSSSVMQKWYLTIDRYTDKHSASLSRSTDQDSGTYAARVNFTNIGSGVIHAITPYRGYITRAVLNQKSAEYYSIDIKKNYVIGWKTKWHSYAMGVDIYGENKYTGKVVAEFLNYNKARILGSKTLGTVSRHTTYTYQTGTLSTTDYPKGTAYVRVSLVADRLSIFTMPAWVQWDTVFIRQTNIPQLRSVTTFKKNGVEYAVAVGDGGVIIRFNGTSWSNIAVTYQYNLNGVYALDYTHIWAVGDNGTILFSSNGGVTWTKQTSTTTAKLNKVYAYDSNHIWVVGNVGTILYSYNGSVWMKIFAPTVFNLNYIEGDSMTSIWVAGDNGTVLKYGLTGEFGRGQFWSKVGVGTGLNLYGIGSIDSNNIWICGKSGTILKGLKSVTAMLLTHLAMGQTEGDYCEDYDPVRSPVDGTLVPLDTQHGQYYRAMAAGETEEWLFNLGHHKGRFLITVNACVSAGTADQINLTFKLKTLEGVAITSSEDEQEIDISAADGYTAIQVFREIAMCVLDRFDNVDFPTHYVSENANIGSIAEAVTLTAGALESDYLWVGFISIIPLDESFVEIKDWGYNTIILDSHGGLVLASLNGSLDSAMVFDGTKWKGSPGFKAKPGGMNLTINSAYKVGTTTSANFTQLPRFNVKARYRPLYYLVDTDEDDE